MIKRVTLLTHWLLGEGRCRLQTAGSREVSGDTHQVAKKYAESEPTDSVRVSEEVKVDLMDASCPSPEKSSWPQRKVALIRSHFEGTSWKEVASFEPLHLSSYPI